MSTYSVMAGEVTYPTQEGFDAVIEVLKKGGWINDEHPGLFVDECGQPHNESGEVKDIDFENRTITIYESLYRNLCRVNFFPEGSNAKGIVVDATTDGDFWGCITIDGNSTGYDLNDWAANNFDEPPPELTEDDENYWEFNAVWQNEVQAAFVEDNL